MGIFSKKELTEEQTTRVNALLPKSLQKEVWFESAFNLYDDGIYQRFKNFIHKNYEKPIENLKKALNTFKQDGLEMLAAKVKILNIEPYESEPLGMADVGAVHQFAASSTGERFSGGLIGYAIESAVDDVWTKGNNQERAVNSVKLELIKKSLTLYPESNMLFKYEVDFREMGSSGNVFIYMRATVCKGENKELEREKIEYNEKIKAKMEELNSLQDAYAVVKKKLDKIPVNMYQLKDLQE